ncbi:hypothetical protein JCM24511_05167 [Saitozyma sp. JCM 24511]|nr:hypothetical protein JCM24511_05167 [Saitozyma sp. JCM 24511]
MRFINLLLPLSLLASAILAVPTEKTADLVERNFGESVDVLSVVTTLKSSVDSCGEITSSTTEVDINLKLTNLCSALDTAVSCLDVNAGWSIGGLFGWLFGYRRSQVAQILHDTICTLNTLISCIDAEIAAQAEIVTLLSHLDGSLCKVLSACERWLSGCLNVCVGLLGSISFCGSFQLVYNLLCPFSNLLHIL